MDWSKVKIPATGITKSDLENIKLANLKKAKEAFEKFPIATKTWLAMRTNLTIDFISKNWKEITH